MIKIFTGLLFFLEVMDRRTHRGEIDRIPMDTSDIRAMRHYERDMMRARHGGPEDEEESLIQQCVHQDYFRGKQQ